MINKNILFTIGHTPLVRIQKLNPYPDVEIYAKLEMFNPSGSIKDRMAVYMIEKAEKRGDLKPGMTIVEATTGNTGIALAMVAAVKDYRMIAVMPANMTEERQQIIKAYGAKVILTPARKGPLGAVLKRDQLIKKSKNAWKPDQFSNKNNIAAHRKSTGLEIIQQLNRRIDVFIAGVGTGGTLIGVAQVLRKKYPKVMIVAVEPAESSVISREKPGKHDIQGIGEGFIPKLVDLKIIDKVEKISTKEAKQMAQKLAAKEGIWVGTSSGADLAAALRVAKIIGRKKTIMTIFPDSGNRYLSQ